MGGMVNWGRIGGTHSDGRRDISLGVGVCHLTLTACLLTFWPLNLLKPPKLLTRIGGTSKLLINLLK